MWTEPEMMMKWWGPNHYSAPSAQIDFRVGGKTVLGMQGPDGKVMYSGGTYKEIIPFKKIVTTDSFSDKEGNPIDPATIGMPDFPKELTVVIEFEEVNGKTIMKMTHGPIGKMGEPMLKNMTQGWNESLDKMVVELKNLQ